MAFWWFWPTSQICSSSRSPMGFTFDSQLANSCQYVQHWIFYLTFNIWYLIFNIHYFSKLPICSTFNISRSNFATIESHSTNWKLQDIHKKEVNFVLVDGIEFPPGVHGCHKLGFKLIYVQKQQCAVAVADQSKVNFQQAPTSEKAPTCEEFMNKFV